MNRDVYGFVRARGQQIVNGEGVAFLLRGVGLGSWLLPEGYMWRMPEAADRPRRIEALVRDLLGPEGAADFWQVYWDRFITEEDVRRIASEGFNSLRVPINARYLTGTDDSEILIESRLQRIDRLIGWCRTHSVYVILDLHGAPGGQTGTNIDDSANDRPELFTDPANQDRTVSMWRSLAERYKDEWIVAGFDLLNEPLPEWFSQYNDRVLPLYRRITEAIREVDRRHMIILEGVHWATDWSVFTEAIDDNLMLQFHKYWNNPDRESLAPYLKAREKLNVPIFMGEGGENNRDWYVGAFRLFEDLDISWNFWTWKKLDTTNSPASVVRPAEWDEVAAFADRSADESVGREHTGPDSVGREHTGQNSAGPERARQALHEFLENLPLGRCTYRPEVVRSLFRRPPIRIPAIFYAFNDRQRAAGLGFVSGHDGENPPPAAQGDATGADALINFRLGDGMQFGYVADLDDDGRHPVPGSPPRTPNFHHNGGEPWAREDWLYVWLPTGSWLAYDFTVPPGEGTRYSVGFRLACGEHPPAAEPWVRASLDAAAPTTYQSQAPTSDTVVLTVTIDEPRQELKLPISTPQPGFVDHWLEAEAQPGLRRVGIRSENTAIRVQAVYVTMTRAGGAPSADYGVTDFGSGSWF